VQYFAKVCLRHRSSPSFNSSEFITLTSQSTSYVKSPSESKSLDDVESFSDIVVQLTIFEVRESVRELAKKMITSMFDSNTHFSMDGQRSEPLSIETLLQKQREEKEAAAKVVSYSKGSCTPNETYFSPDSFRRRNVPSLPLPNAQKRLVKRGNDKKQPVVTEKIWKGKQESWPGKRDLQELTEGVRVSVILSSAFDSQHRHFFHCTDQDRYADRDRDRDRRGDRHGRRDRDGPRGKDRAPRGGFENVPTAPRAERQKAAGSTVPSSGDITMASPTAPSMPPPPPPSASNASLPDSSNIADGYVLSMTDNDLTAIRSRYLGVDKKRRKPRKMNDKKFVFDWDAQDDTLVEDSPTAMGSNRQGAQVMYGRGKLAGMDDGAGAGPTRKGSTAPQLADARERRNAAKAGYDDRHWTEKPLDEMKERDWRIFREDFSISARGMIECALLDCS
jgi:ATP-dependent RNA helicase DDX23/PRP28